MWISLIIAALALTAGISTSAWTRTRRKLKQSHQEREDLANSSLVIEEERCMLDLMAQGASLHTVLDSLTRAIERISPGAIATVLLLDEEHRRFLLKGSGPSMPAEYLSAVNGLEIGPDIGACGSAAYRNETIVVEDIATDYRFETARGFVLSYGLRSCWSVPIRDSKGMVLGTFAIYHRYPSTPRAEELRMTRAAAQLAGNAVERLRAEEILRETTQRLHLAEQVAQFGIWQADPARNSIEVSEVLAAMIGRSGPSVRLTREECLSLIHAEDAGSVQTVVAAAVRGETIQHEFRLILPDGSLKWVRSLWRFDEPGDSAGIRSCGSIGALVDITKEKNILERLENACLVAEAAATAARDAGRLEQDRKTILELVVKDQPLDHILHVMAAAVARHLPGSYCSVQLELPGAPRIAVSPRLPERVASALASLPVAGFQQALVRQNANYLSNEPLWQELVDDHAINRLAEYLAVPILRNGRGAGMIISFFEDSSAGCPENQSDKDHVLESWGQFASLAVERRGLYDQLSYRAQYDSLTSLLNRSSLYERLEAEIRKSSREGGSMAVLYLDLDRFKEINDHEGHGAGDAVLQNVARQILQCVRRTDLAARIGGDEFVVILAGVGERAEAARIGNLIVSSISESSLFQRRERSVGASYGISVFPGDGRDADSLLTRADEDMYRSKMKRHGPHSKRTSPVSTPDSAPPSQCVIA